jgi:histidinol phosphatase-like enzyme (inositol monophosphatase family)
LPLRFCFAHGGVTAAGSGTVRRANAAGIARGLEAAAAAAYEWGVTYLDTALQAADAAGAVIRRYFRSRIGADQKADLSPVTLADRQAEQAMRAIIAQNWPEHGILGEEYGAERDGHAYQWVLDPIDGTRAFITGRPVFGALIALLRDGVPLLGIIDQPVTGERWIGVAGEPTRFSSPFGGQAGTRACGSLAAAELSATSPAMMGDDLPRWERLSAAVRRTSWGGDCYAYGLLALGHIDIVAERDLKIWDWAALVPVVEGAGGRMVDWEGRALVPGCDGDAIAVGDAGLLPAALAALSR